MTGHEKALLIKAKLELYCQREHAIDVRVWMDIEQNPNTAGMIDGVQRSRHFLLLVTSGVFARQWVLFELLCALRLRKNIVIVYEVNVAFGGAEQNEFSDQLMLALRTRFPEADQGQYEGLLSTTIWLQWDSAWRVEHGEATLQQILGMPGRVRPLLSEEPRQPAASK